MNEEEFDDYLEGMAERDWQRYLQEYGDSEEEERDRNVHRLIDGEFECSRGADGLPDFDYEQRVQREIEEFEQNVLNYMRGQTIRMENERVLEHGLRTPCMN